jgi:hypothetical protein
MYIILSGPVRSWEAPSVEYKERWVDPALPAPCWPAVTVIAVNRTFGRYDFYVCSNYMSAFAFSCTGLNVCIPMLLVDIELPLSHSCI